MSGSHTLSMVGPFILGVAIASAGFLVSDFAMHVKGKWLPSSFAATLSDVSAKQSSHGKTFSTTTFQFVHGFYITSLVDFLKSIKIVHTWFSCMFC